MLHIYYTIFEQARDADQWQAYLKQMPTPILDRVVRYRQEINKSQLVYGRLLLQKLSWDLGFADFQLKDIQYTAHNKPFWRTGIDFSIAHSGNIVGCALSTQGTIGLDIEKIQPININNFEHILNTDDQTFLKKSNNIHKDFFKIWTIKEAVSKADGRGLSMDVKDIRIQEQKATCFRDTWDIREIDIHSEYRCHFAMPTPIQEKAIIKKIRF